MVSSFIYAGKAIESICSQNFAEFNNYRWSDMVPSDLPSDGPGFTIEAWKSVATKIVVEFNQNIAPHEPINVTANQKLTSHSKRLVEFQMFLAATADQKLAKIIIAQFAL